MISTARARLLVLAAAALFSTGGAAIKACSLGGWQVACFRSGIAALVLALCVPAARRALSRRALLVGLAYAATVILFVLANKLTTAANAIFLQSTSPIWVLVLGRALLGERARRSDFLVLAGVAAGLALIVAATETPQVTAPQTGRGNVLALASGLAFALAVLGMRWLGRGDGSGGEALGGVLAGNILACLVAAPFALPVESISAHDLWILLFLGTLQISLAYACLAFALPRVTALAASLLLLLEPALNPVWTWLVHGEEPAPLALAGGGVILAAMVLGSLTAPRES